MGGSPLLVRFALVSAIALATLGGVLAAFYSRQIRSNALAHSTSAAVMLARGGIQPLLGGSDLRNGVSAAHWHALDRALAAAHADGRIARIKVWNRAGRIVYSDDGSLVGLTFAPDAHVLRTLATGAVGVATSNRGEATGSRTHGERLLDVHVPLRTAGSRRVEGVFELFLPYSPVARAIARDTQTMLALLAGGLLLVWVALFRLVVGADRELRRRARENERQALHDALTGLPNRLLFLDRVGHAIHQARRDRQVFAVLLMDLDRFKEINDTLGHDAGDRLIREVADRLRAAVRDGDTVARLGGDEFAILLRNVSPAFLGVVAQRIHASLEQPFPFEDLIIDVEASIGIALHPDHGDDVATLVQRADVAMYAAKTTQTRFAVYDPQHDGYNRERLALVGELRRAIVEGELVLHYQPKATLASGAIESVEALVRWQHPVRGLLPPSEFIPIAQRTGLIKPLTFYVLDTALEQVATWQAEGIALAVAVNLSPRSLQDLELPEEVARALDRWQLDPRSLQLEITEDSIVADPARTREVLSRLSAMGVRLAIDDFGTGYSSLAHLRSLPISELKIDRSFVMNMDGDENDAVIVRSTIDLGRNLGLDVVAEGVETAKTWALLAALGCDLVQGYYLSRPMAADDVAGWLAARCTRALAS